jgi:hypothetical protein
MKKLYRVNVTETHSTEVMVFAEDRDSAEEIVNDADLDFDYCGGDYDYDIEEINDSNKLDKSELEEIPYGDDEDRTCKEILEGGDIELEKWIPPKSQLSFSF